MSLCEETPRPIGEKVSGKLFGKRYILELSADEWTKEGREGSEYSERVVQYHWYEGEAHLYERPNEHDPVACFLFKASKHGLSSEIKDAILRISDFGQERTFIHEVIVPGGQENILDRICEKALETYRSQSGKQIPRIHFDGVSRKDLVEAGLAFDSSDQAHLALTD